MPMARRIAWTALGSGPLLGAAVMRYAAPLQSAGDRAVLGPWYRLSAAGATARPGPLIAAVSGFVVAWAVVAWQAQASPGIARLAARLSPLWALPFALGAPVLSQDVYAYAAQGAVLDGSGDPYRSGPAALGAHVALVRAVDPMWRQAASPYGPLALRLEQLAVLVGGRGVGALLALRVLAALSVLGLVLLVRHLTAPEHRDLVTWLVLSPLTLLQLLGAVHWEAEMAALLALSWALSRHGRHTAAIVVAVLAVDIKATAAVVAIALLWRTRALGGALLAAAVTVLLYPTDPLGWLRNLGVSSKAWSPYAPASTLYLVLTHLQPERAHLLLVCRIATALLAASVALVVVARPFTAAQTCGLLTLAAVAALPTVWPWYVAPACVLLLLDRPRRWEWCAVLTAVGSLACLPVTTELAQRVMLVAEAVGVVVCAGIAVSRRGSWRPALGHVLRQWS